MFLTDIIKKMTPNIWIPTGFMSGGVILLWITQNSTFLNVTRRLSSESSANFVANTGVIIGLPLVIISLISFFLWIKTSNKERATKRQQAWQSAARSLEWNYSENYLRELSPYIEISSSAAALI